MTNPTRNELALSDDNSEFDYIISGTTSFDSTGPLLSGGSTTVTKGWRSSTVTGGDITNYGYIGVNVVTNLTGISGGAVDVKTSIQGKDITSGQYYDIATGSTFTSGGAFEVLQVHPSFVSGVIVVAGALSGAGTNSTIRAVDFLPKTWRIKTTHVGTNAARYTVGVSPVLD